MNYNHEDAVTIRTNGRKNDASALCALKDVLEGKALIYDACTETPHHGAPDWECDMVITFLPYLSDDGRALLKIDCHSVPYRNDAEEKFVPMAYDWRNDPGIDTLF